MKNIKISQILEDLASGLFRSPSSNGYDAKIGSIKEKYNLNDKELKALFEHSKLKGKKRGQQTMELVIEDDTEDEIPQVAIQKGEIPNASGLTSDHFDAPWDKEIQQAREIAKQTTNIQED